VKTACHTGAAFFEAQLFLVLSTNLICQDQHSADGISSVHFGHRPNTYVTTTYVLKS